MHNGPLTRRQALWAVLLSSPTTSALCGMTVLELHRVWGFATTQIHVLVTKGGRVLAVPNVDITVHETRTFPTEDVRLFDDFRATLPRRAVIDAASWAPDDFTAARVLVAGVQQIRVPPMLLREQVQKRTKLPRRRLLLLLCNDLEGGAQALSEIEFLRFCVRHGLPRPILQVRHDSAGRRRYLDATFRRRDSSVFHVEVDGGIHLKLEVRSKDDIKDNDAKLDRKLVLRYTSFAIYTDQPDAVRQITRAFG